MESLGKLAGGIAHDFNNILGAILGYSDFILEDTRMNDPIHAFAKNISTATLRGKSLVDQILAFARQQRTAPTVFALQSVIEESEQILRVAIPSTITVRTETLPAPIYLMADKNQIGQILMNLCLNARDAFNGKVGQIVIGANVLPAGDALLLKCAETGTTTHAVQWDLPDGSHVAIFGTLSPQAPHAVLSVSDSGAGIESETLSKIFDPFFTTKEVGKGTGLGLSVILGIVLDHHGAIAIHTKAGHGSMFKILLPQAEP